MSQYKVKRMIFISFVNMQLSYMNLNGTIPSNIGDLDQMQLL